jgi:hypothetical protein
VAEEGVDLLFRGAPIPLVALADQSETLQRETRQFHRLWRERQAVDRCTVSEKGTDIAEVDAKRDRSGSLACSIPSELNEPFAVQISKTYPAKPVLEQVHTEALGTADRLSHLFHVAKVEVYKVAERLDACDLLGRWRLTEVDLALDPSRPQFGVLAQNECLAEVATLVSDLNAPLAGRKL